MSQWSILRVTPHMERKVRDVLIDQGVPCLVPEERFRPANHWRPRTRPLMPGYVFAELRNDDALDIARANHAVREVMCRDGRPVRCPPVLIGVMILLEAWRAFDSTSRVPVSRRDKRRGRRAVCVSRWEHGQRVKVSGGPFAGFFAEVLRAERADRVEILVSIFGRVTEVSLDEEMVEAA